MGSRQPAKDGRVYTTVRLDPALVERLDCEARVRTVSRTFLIERAVTEWLDANEGAA